MDAATRRRIAIGASAVILVSALFVLYIHKPPNPDQGIFDYIGWVGSEGGRYYVDVAEQNFPGEMLLHELALRVFGVGIRSFRALDFIIAVGGALSLLGLLRLAGFGPGAYIGAAFYLVGYASSNAWLSGQRDIIAANLLLLVGYLFALRLRGGRRILILPLDLALFLAVLLRPTYLIFPVLLAALDAALARSSGRKAGARLADAGLVAAGLAACAAAMLAWGALSGSLADFWEQAVLFNFQAYGEGHSRLDTLAKMASAALPYAVFAPAAAVAVARAGRGARRDAPLWILLGLVALALVSAFVQNKGFGYHLGAMLAPLFGLAGAAAWIAVESFRGRGRPSAKYLALTAAVLGLAGLLFQVRSLGPQIRYLLGRETYLQMMARESAGEPGLTWADLHAAADFAREKAGPSQTILVWGRPTSIHLLALRRSPTRFITTGMLVLARPPFERWERWIGEFRDAVRRDPPVVVFVAGADARALDAGPSGGGLETAAGDLRSLLAGRYELARTFGSMSAYELKR